MLYNVVLVSDTQQRESVIIVSICLVRLWFFLWSEKLPLRVDFIHRGEFGEMSGHPVLIKRGPGNRGPTECGTTHEATSGMSL